MKKIFMGISITITLAIILICVVILLPTHDNNEIEIDLSEFIISPPLNFDPRLADVEFTITARATRHTVTTHMTNNSEYDIGWGDTNFEVFDGEYWRVIPTIENFGFALVLLILMAGEYVENDNPFQQIFNPAPRSGLFRTRRTISIIAWDSYAEFIPIPHDLVVEFVLP